MVDAYRYVIWDWNGTILDDLELVLDIANGMLRRRGLATMDRRRYRDIFDFPVVDYYRRAGFDFRKEPFSGLADEFINEYNRRVGECSLHTGITDVLDTLARSGKGQVILSASRQESLDDAVSRYGLAGYFHRLQGLPDHMAVSKVASGRALIRDLGEGQVPSPAVPQRPRPEEVVMIGDTVHDYEVAREMGVHCILVARGHQSEERLRKTGAPVISEVSQLLDSQPFP
jgi:phosphoglycolate phosphatase